MSVNAPSAVIFGCGDVRLSSREKAFFRDADPWGFILFARNIERPEQVRALTAALREAVGRDAPVMIDQEGGRVQRLKPPIWRGWEDAAEMIAACAPDDAVEATRLRYQLIAAELRAVGVDVNCAPVLDVAQSDAHPSVGPRMFSGDPAVVAALGRAACEGLEAGGAAPVVKHLPGYGRALVDPHLALPRVTAEIAALDSVDFAPFRAHADARMGMTAHVLYDAVDPDACATFSPAVIRLIREDIGFGGLLMTDDLSMEALSGTIAERAIRALLAGCDLVLHCNGVLDQMQAVATAAPRLSGLAESRAERAAVARPPRAVMDEESAWRRYRDLVRGCVDA